MSDLTPEVVTTCDICGAPLNSSRKITCSDRCRQRRSRQLRGLEGPAILLPQDRRRLFARELGTSFVRPSGITAEEWARLKAGPRTVRLETLRVLGSQGFGRACQIALRPAISNVTSSADDGNQEFWARGHDTRR